MNCQKQKQEKIRRFVLKDFVKNISNEEVEIDEPKTEEYEILKNYFYDLKNRKISPKAHIQLDLGLDSLDMVEFLHFVETKFGIADKEIVLNILQQKTQLNILATIEVVKWEMIQTGLDLESKN